jgi:hypothetical protein
MFSSPARTAVNRSMPIANPACGGAPYRNASSRNPKRERASSGVIPRSVNTCCCTSEEWIRTLPEPSSQPLSTRS